MSLKEVITQPQTNLALRSASAGALVWLVLLFLPISDVTGITYIERLFLLSPLVIVPLGLSLIESHEMHGLHTWPYRIALLVQPIGALFCVASFFFNQGFVAASLACGWLFVTGVIASFGAWRFVLRGAMRVEEICLSFGLMAIAVGGAWFVMSRFGALRAQFGDTIVLLTAVHFHYTGFAASLLMSFAGRLLRASDEGKVSPFYYIAVICLIGGTPVVAAGITLSSGPLGLIGAAAISLGLWLLAAIVMVKIIDTIKSWPARILLFISSLSSSASMVLACLYAYSLVSKKLIINIPKMAEFHGVANAIGFALCGMLAWLLIRKGESGR
jgi:hypothetical protein